MKAINRDNYKAVYDTLDEWVCTTEGCKGTQETIWIDPTNYNEGKIPFCSHCQNDMVYLFTYTPKNINEKAPSKLYRGPKRFGHRFVRRA